MTALTVNFYVQIKKRIKPEVPRGQIDPLIIYFPVAI
tara:strand:- start:241 stop:351 length:111 start_codon:yes stop_codon:yes gene_type:complete